MSNIPESFNARDYVPANAPNGQVYSVCGLATGGMPFWFAERVDKGRLHPELRRKLSSQAAPKLVEAGL